MAERKRVAHPYRGLAVGVLRLAARDARSRDTRKAGRAREWLAGDWAGELCEFAGGDRNSPVRWVRELDDG